MGNTRKRHKDRASSTTSISSSPAQSKGPSHKKRNNAVVDTDGDYEVEREDTDVDHTTSASAQNLEKDQDQLDAEELKVFQAPKLWCYGAVQQFKLLIFATQLWFDPPCCDQAEIGILADHHPYHHHHQSSRLSSHRSQPKHQYKGVSN
ncbi:hypothetical protein PGT21_006963 [Puccinia graminis f. sp. tritici]|uniref:Uncharacterized protein n=1 Tax=Puccinia graminis f. sp. tritici TaxID=56615 RepID=A0A5B0LKW2_PUCGR|nr:hypothetical protein PGT21_006963 [Puccinia graminis f. sp. tritici]